jgi:hypothetical protein
MIDFPNLQEIKIKELKTICMVVGGFYSAYGLFSLGLTRLQSFMLTSIEPIAFEAEVFDEMHRAHDDMYSFMPLLVMLGLGYLLFGLFMHRATGQHMRMYFTLTILTLLWVGTYLYRSLDNFMANRETLLTGVEFLDSITLAFTLGGSLFMLMLFVIPPIIIGNKLRQYNRLFKPKEPGINNQRF